MGYVKEKYTKGYFLREDERGNPMSRGVLGIEEFRQGDIRSEDKAILKRIDFNGKKVIDFGFGRGEAIKYALDNGASFVIGVDFSEASLDIAKKMLNDFKLSADLYCEDALDFVKNDKKYQMIRESDIVIMLDFIEHVPRTELKELLLVLKKLLPKKSILAVNTPVFKIDNDIIKEGIKEEAAEHTDENDLISGMHCNRYTKESLKKFMEGCGFGLISGHFFGKDLGIDDGKDYKCRWRKSLAKGYPIRGDWEEDAFEYAIPPE
jgi:cyclopropane fatty-acyl-phospholipid synthase-like methyltransferase